MSLQWKSESFDVLYFEGDEVALDWLLPLSFSVYESGGIGICSPTLWDTGLTADGMLEYVKADFLFFEILSFHGIVTQN